MFVESYLKQLRKHRFAPHAAALYVWKCVRLSIDEARARPAIMGGVLLAGILHLLVLFGLAALLSFNVSSELGPKYFVVSAWWLLGGLAWISLHLGMFRHDREIPHSGLGLPNFLTLGRLLCIPAFTVLILAGETGLAIAAFLMGGLTDVADGFAARKLNVTTRLGKVFDPIVDVIFNAAVSIGLYQAGYLPGWLLALIISRYSLLMVGAAGIYVFKGPVAVRPTVLGKTTGVVTAGLILALMIVITWPPARTTTSLVELLHAALGFIFGLSIIQVMIMGWYNIRHSGEQASPEGSLSVVVGRGEE